MSSTEFTIKDTVWLFDQIKWFELIRARLGIPCTVFPIEIFVISYVVRELFKKNIANPILELS